MSGCYLVLGALTVLRGSRKESRNLCHSALAQWCWAGEGGSSTRKRGMTVVVVSIEVAGGCLFCTARSLLRMDLAVW